MLADNGQLTDILLNPIFLLQNNGFRVQPSAIEYQYSNFFSSRDFIYISAIRLEVRHVPTKN